MTFTTRFIQVTSAVLILGLMAGLCGCDQLASILSTETAEHIIDTSIEFDVGLALPLTGTTTASTGLSMQRGFNLARDEINELDSPVRINFILEDDGGTAEGAVAAVERLIDAGVTAILGIAYSNQARQVFPITESNGVIAISPLSAAAGLSGIGEYTFRTALAVNIKNTAGIKATHAQLGYERAAVIYNDAEFYSISSREYMTAPLADLGVDVLTVQTFQTGDTDLTAQLTEITRLNPDVLFIPTLASEAVGIMVQARQLGITSQFILSALGIEEIEMAGDAAEGAITFGSWSSESDNPLSRAFVENYRSTYGVEPDPWAAQSYATLFILFRAIVDTVLIDPAATDAASIRDTLAMTKDFDTNLGRFSFDPNGEAVYDPVVLVVKHSNLEVFGSDAM
ncbi:MAG: ABC transporter substrate-binding protein [Candidatus Poribacteria bacterium]|nr:ABC transporter substrate-binding protein [Candidatus Poribacteria bacterium]